MGFVVNSGEEALGSQRRRPKGGILFTSNFWKDFWSLFYNFELSDPPGSGESKEKPGEPQSSKVNENPEGPKTDKAPSKGTGGKKVFKPKELKIRWQEESKYWSIPEGDGPAELLKVCWLDVSGEMNVTKGKTYEVSFMLSMNKNNSFGWDDVPVTVMARIGKEGEYQRKEIYLSDLGKNQVELPHDKCRIEFKSDDKAKNNGEKLYFGLYETLTNKWKGGLRIHEAIVQEIPAGNNASTSNTRSD